MNCDRLNQSLHQSCNLLNRPKAAFLAVLGLLAIHSVLLLYSSYVHSPTLNEPGHLVAGLSHWELGRYELYRVNPPLVRMVASLPVMLADYEPDWKNFHEGPGTRPVFEIGLDFLDANGERSFWLLTLARWACLPFSWVGGAICYLWARDLFGRPSGVLACTLWCFSPNILAHVPLITPDAHASSLGVAACYLFWRWLKRPTWLLALGAGITLGLAESSKATMVLLYAIWPMLWLLRTIANGLSLQSKNWWRQATMLVVQMVVSLVLLNAVYGFDRTFTRLKELEFVSHLFTGGEVSASSFLSTEAQSSALESGNRFRNSFLGEMPIVFPKEYLLGIDIQQKDFEDPGKKSYLSGEVRYPGWWYYYLWAAELKIPVGTWLLGIALLLMHGRGELRLPSFTNCISLLLPLALILIVVSSKTGYTNHFRYVLPCFPFAFIWISQIASLPNSEKQSAKNNATQEACFNFWPITVLVLLLWSCCSSLWVYPHSIAYFNEIAGGPLNGPKHLLTSNCDWGQDYFYLRDWVENHPEQRPVYMAYHGNLFPKNHGLHTTLPWPKREYDHASRKADSYESKAVSNELFRQGYYAISVSPLFGLPSSTRDGAGSGDNISQQACYEARLKMPYARAGYSIWIYKFPNHQSAKR